MGVGVGVFTLSEYFRLLNYVLVILCYLVRSVVLLRCFIRLYPAWSVALCRKDDLNYLESRNAHSVQTACSCYSKLPSPPDVLFLQDSVQTGPLQKVPRIF